MVVSIPTRFAAPTMALVAGSVLAWEIVLTRLASLRYHFHFGFLAVSVGLLGMGISGAVLAATVQRWRADPCGWLRRWTAGYLSAILLGGVGLYLLPVHLGVMNSVGVGCFVAFIVLGGLPFLAGGGIIGLLLSADREVVHRRYGIDLLAAGVGCIGVLQVLESWGAGGALCVIAAAAVGAVVVQQELSGLFRGLWLLPVGLLLVSPRVDGWCPAPSKITRPIHQTTWTRLSRVDEVAVADESRTVRARGRAVDPKDVPPQVELMQDGSASTLLTDYTGHPGALSLIDGTLFSAAVRLRPGAKVLVIGVGGGDDVWAAVRQGARHVRGVDLHAPMIAAHGPAGRGWTRAWGKRVSLSVAEGRSTLMRDDERYDVVQMTGIDTWAAVTSGAYALVENTLYTTEAFSQMMERLAPGGVLQVVRMAAQMETLRVLTHVDAASLGRRTVPLAQAVIVLGAVDHLVATLVRLDGFSEGEVHSVRTWAAESGLDVLHLPGHEMEGPISTFVRSANRSALIDSFDRNIAPTVDDSPYFFNFTRWTRPVVAAETIGEPTYISQGNPLFVLGHLTLGLLVAGLVLFGTVRMGRGSVPPVAPTAYFALVGIGFIGIELGLMQKLSLFLGHPLLSLSITLAGLLMSTGIGALWSGQWMKRRWWLGWVPLGLAVWIGTLLVGMPWMMSQTLDLGTGGRALLAMAVLAPGGVLLGIPFAWGLATVRRDVVPWAWAVNGFCTVIGAVLTVVVSMVAGFSTVLVGSVAAYGIAVVVWRGKIAVHLD